MSTGLGAFIEMRKMMTSTLAQVEKAAKHTLSQVEKAATQSLAHIGKAVTHVLSQVGKNASHMVSQVGKSATHAAGQANKAINHAFDNVGKQASKMLSAIKAQSGKSSGSGEEKKERLFSKVGEKIKDKVVDFAADLPGKIWDGIKDGMKDAKEMKDTYEELGNMMYRTGTYSEEAFAKTSERIQNLTANTGFTNTQMATLQSELMRAGVKGETELNRISKASSDLGTVLKKDLSTAGKMLTDAFKDPKALKDLGKELNISSKEIKNIQGLMAHGKKNEAQKEIVTAVERSKAGGAAERAFNEDPALRFAKAMHDLKTSIGEVALKIQVVLLPPIDWLAKKMSGVVNWLKEHEEVATSLAIGLGVLAGAILAVSVATAIWNAILAINPVVLIIIAVVAVIATIAWLVSSFEGWGATLKALWEIIKAFGRLAVLPFRIMGETIMYWMDLAGLKIKEFAEWAHLKFANVGEAFQKLWKFDFSGAKEAFNREIKTKTTEEIEKLKKKHEANQDAFAIEGIEDVATIKSEFKKIKITKKAHTAELPKTNFTGADGKAGEDGGIERGVSSGAARSMAGGITSGGPRVININGVKFTDKIELHSVNVKEGVNELQGMLEEMFLRILNSGAVLQ